MQSTGKFFSFGFAMSGLREAVRRLDEGNTIVPMTVVEIAWWISAAAKACGHHKDGDVLQGFWWVRNKGSHGTEEAFAVVMWPGAWQRESDGGAHSVDYGTTERQWQRIPEDLRDGDAAKAYVNNLEDNAVRETIDEALEMLKGYGVNEMGISGLGPDR